MQETQFYLTEETSTEYPRLLNGEEFGILKRLMARLDRSTVGYNLFLGYCGVHKKYYLDHSHTNGEIRCPICDEEWIKTHKQPGYSLARTAQDNHVSMLQ